MDGILDDSDHDDLRQLLGAIRAIAAESQEHTVGWKCRLSGSQGRYFISVKTADGTTFWDYAGSASEVLQGFRLRMARVDELRKYGVRPSTNC